MSDKAEAKESEMAKPAVANEKVDGEKLAMYQCPQGFIVKHPTECHANSQADDILPKLTVG